MSVHFYLICHMWAFGIGFLLDLLLGDPRWIYHPVRLIGNLISLLERWLRGAEQRARNLESCHKKNEAAAGNLDRQDIFKGTAMVLVVICVTVLTAGVLLAGAYYLHPYVGILAECIMTWQILAVKGLKAESMRVYHSLEREGLSKAREAVSWIVGRDTAQLDEAGVIRAAVETVAENTSDGVVAPMLYLCLGGPILGFGYKAVNTMDSMVGYKNEKYLYFGRAAAKLDDVVNFIPARISAVLMLLVCISGREFNFRQALRIYRRDRRKHASPNSAQTESVCAGALGLRLAGPAYYFGKRVKKPFIGEALRPIEAEDIVRVNRLMVRTAWLCEVVCLGILGGLAACGM